MIKLYDDKPIILKEGIPINDYDQTTLDWNEYQKIQDEFEDEINSAKMLGI